VLTEIAPGVVLQEEALREICERHQIRELSIFGSAVRGEMRPDSDVDLPVESLPGAQISLLRHFAAERELTTLR
jgi:predicted nucleotidyltransferase